MPRQPRVQKSVDVIFRFRVSSRAKTFIKKRCHHDASNLSLMDTGVHEQLHQSLAMHRLSLTPLVQTNYFQMLKVNNLTVLRAKLLLLFLITNIYPTYFIFLAQEDLYVVM